MSARAAEDILKELSWKSTLGGGLFAPIGPKRLVALMKELEIPNPRVPRFGMEILLHKQGDGAFWVENSSGRFTVKAIGDWRSIIPDLAERAKFDVAGRSPWRRPY